MLTQSFVTDMDDELLSFGLNSPGTATYASSAGPSGWSGDLSGSFGGQSLSAAYSFDPSSYPTGPITWTGSGAVGTTPLTSSGSMSFTDTGGEGFQASVNGGLTVGALPVKYTAAMEGTVSGDSIIQTSELLYINIYWGAFSYHIVWSKLDYDKDTTTGEYTSYLGVFSYAENLAGAFYYGGWQQTNSGMESFPGNKAEVEERMISEALSLPEPSSFILAVSALPLGAGIVYVGRRRLKRA